VNAHDMFDLTGKVALVTGGSRGLGLQMARGLGELGAKVAISARSQDDLDAASAALAAEGITVVALRHDLGAVDRVGELVDRVVAMDQGAVIADGEPQAVMRDPAVVTAYLGGGAHDDH